LFEGKRYTGIDISKPAIKYCKKNSKFDFRCGDFLKMDFDNKFDFIFSLAVIDHVYDIDLFLSKVVKLTKKNAYINSYRGYNPALKKHEMIWKENISCYHNRLSPNVVRDVLLQAGLEEDEFKIRPQDVGEKAEFTIQTVIEINKK